MRKILFLAAILAAGAAHADFIPRVRSGQNVATVSLNGGSLTYSQPWGSGTLGALIVDAQNVPRQIENGLNAAAANAINGHGATFGRGTVTGTPTLTLRPDASGVVFATMTGLSYRVTSSFSGTKWGVINYSCTNTTDYNNITVTAQYGTADGVIPPTKVGINGTLNTSTDCDSNLSWILPVLGDILINKAEGKVDAGIANAVQNGLAGVTQNFFFKRDQNWLVGLNRLIPADKVVTYPGGSFPIGQYIANNLPYLIANSQITLKLGRGANLNPVLGTNEPPYDLSGDAITLTLTSPGVNFTANLSEQVNVYWLWQCSIANPSRKCQDPR
ncbi:hypothetical protein [Rugamonas aquatica]|uniref:Uncharacterized protein n=1 Tax=Rugamonas aquatica TaxID=2743357 RepID=A0A6A7N2W4_9BURK|nr:hypothetical protein [Rugamonas aquatica]MQA39327.1 hypothetical protein [Rugamonas aquatica]